MKLARRGLAICLAMACCTSGPSPQRPSPLRSPAGPTPGAPVPSLTESVQPSLTLSMDLSQPAASWERVAFLPFGPSEDRLGLHHFSESTDSLPSAFQVDAGGSFWIADRWKDRLARFDRGGAFLQAISIPLVRSKIRDFVIVDGRFFVITEGHEYAIREVRAGGGTTLIQPRVEGGFLAVNFLFPVGPAPVFEADNVRVPPRWNVEPGPAGIWTTDPAGEVRLLPGIPAGPGRWFSLRPREDLTFDLHRIGAATDVVQPLRLRCRVRGADGRMRSIPAVATLLGPTPVNDGRDLVMLVQMSPSRPKDAARFGGGRWLLRMGSSPVLWERLPYSDRADETLWRQLAVGPDGAIYQMLARRGGMEILRRP